jgi:large subunit ribosomal protein L22
MEVSARLKGARISAQKARLVATRSAASTSKRRCRCWSSATRRPPASFARCSNSAIANAENNEGADVDELKVVVGFCRRGYDDEASSRRAPRVALTEIFKRSCHITVVADGES